MFTGKNICDYMAKSFACRDIGLSCAFRASAEEENELMDKVSEHARDAHNMRSIDKKTLSKIKAAIKEK